MVSSENQDVGETVERQLSPTTRTCKEMVWESFHPSGHLQERSFFARQAVEKGDLGAVPINDAVAV